MGQLTSDTSNQILDPTEILAHRLGLKMESEIDHYPLIETRNRLLPYSFVKKHSLIPLKEEGSTLYIAIVDPFNLAAIEEASYMTGKSVVEVIVSKAKVDKAIERVYQQGDAEASEFIQGLDEKKAGDISYEKDAEYDLLDHDADSSVIKVLNMMIIEALGQGASDIHFEPMENGLLVRYRVDGILQLKHTLPSDVESQLITRIKVLAQLDIAEHRLPQDGRIKLKMGGREIDFRVSSVPIVFGERIVLRILDRSQLVVGFEKLGMRERLLAKLKGHIHKAQGMILVTGPTGSGKSTTLYSALAELQSPEINIMTIEDPVEFKIEGMAQISVNAKIGLDFAKGLRHILRQDPDVVMIGEIRDKETAEIAIAAALTGHLVMSTLHTNDAASAIARLVDMGIEPYLISSSLICVLAQRLVRSICSNCGGSGCNGCYGSGYRGRSGIYELMEITPQIRAQIAKSAESSLIQEIALKDGMVTLYQEGLKLVQEGVTTMDEFIRVTSAIGDH